MILGLSEIATRSRPPGFGPEQSVNRGEFLAMVMDLEGIDPEIVLPESPVLRELDAGAVSRVFSNIIGNAVKYSDGDLSVILSADGRAVFSNTARGFNAVDAGRLFDRFYTVESGRGSTGLGLSIARVLTERMGGSVEAAYCGGKLSVTVSFGEK